MASSSDSPPPSAAPSTALTVPPLNTTKITEKGFFESIVNFLTPRSSKEHMAAATIQAAARAWLSRKKVRYLRTMRRLVALMAGRERKYAMMIQRTWREKKLKALEEHAVKIQAHAKGRIERMKAEQTKLVEDFAKNHAAKVIQKHATITVEKTKMMRECQAILEKQGRKYGVGKWEMVVWQERFVTLSHDGLVYQHVKSNAEAFGREKVIEYASMETIKALLGDMLYLKCAKREYYFQLPNAQECEKWATNIVQLAQCAGYSVPGYVVMPPEAMPAPDFGEKEQEA